MRNSESLLRVLESGDPIISLNPLCATRLELFSRCVTLTEFSYVSQELHVS